MNYLDDWMEPEDSSRVLGVRGQGHSSIRSDAQILAGGQMPEAQLLLPTNHVSWIVKRSIDG